MPTTVQLLVFLAVMWPVATVVGWLTVQDIPGRPWSWRVLAGPVIYGRWIDRRA